MLLLPKRIKRMEENKRYGMKIEPIVNPITMEL